MKKRIKLPSFLSKKEMESLLSTVKKDRHRLGIALMLYGGLRVSEMCRLRISNIHLARGFIKVNGKGDKQRIVPLTPKLQKLMENYLVKYGSTLTQESYLVGRTRVSWHYAVKKYTRKLLERNDLSCHSLRHSFATALYEDGVQIEKISQLLGHSKLDTTMIYSHLSMEQKRSAVMTLENPRFRFMSFLLPMRKYIPDMAINNTSSLIGREKELTELNTHLNNKISVILFGPKGAGKSAILKSLENIIYISEYRKKQTLIKIIIESSNLEAGSMDKEVERELKRLSIDELIEEIKGLNKIIVIDDITDLSRQDKKTITRLSESSLVAASTSRHSDIKYFKTYVEIKPLKRPLIRQILSEMIQINDVHKKETLISDILHSSGENLKEAEYMANQLKLGKASAEIVSEERESNQVTIAPALLIVVLFFTAWVLKSYATTIAAFSYAMMVVFRLVFYKYIFSPAASTRKIK